MKIRLPIDIKSLYFNIKNDNEKGHTATVATPLKQGASIHHELCKIRSIPENINPVSRENLVSKILFKSRAEVIITDVFVFDKISVNGEIVDTESSFCMYIREETGIDNVHLGRQKVHYPQSLNYSDLDVDINNREVLRKVSEALKDYAFIVEAFEYDTETKILNFDAFIAGENNIPYSKVFLNKKGVGNKFSAVFNEYADIYDSEIISLREHLGYDAVGPHNFVDILKSNNEMALTLVANSLSELNIEDYYIRSNEYPYTLYDIEYKVNNIKQYIIVRYTSTKIKYFNLSYNKIRFCNDFYKNIKIALITDINGTPCISYYSIDELNNMNKTINSITYESRSDV